MAVGKAVQRVDAFDKVTGRAAYTDDLCGKNAYIARVLHSTIAHGRVLSIDTSLAKKVEGVVGVFTCFDLKEKNYYTTPGHPLALDPKMRDIEDRLVLTDIVRFYGDDIGAVVAENEIAAEKALRLSKVEYEEYPFVLDVQEAMKDGAPLIHEEFPNNILEHTEIREGDLKKAISEPGLIKVEGWYETPMMSHCHIENHICYAEMKGNRMHIVTSTQVPFIVRRVIAQALGIDWGRVRVVKPYIGGGFGNKQDVLYEPLCAWLCMQVGGHLVKMDTPREETFVCNRVRHGCRAHVISWLHPDGTFAARKLEVYSDQGAYASHGHAICAVEMASFRQIYPCENIEIDGWTVYTNKPVAGAMRGYGVPESMWVVERHTEDISTALSMDSIEFRKKNLMSVGYVDMFSARTMTDDSYNQCLDKAMAATDYLEKRKKYQGQSGNLRRGIGAAVFWFDTGTWPALLENSSCRMVMNEDGTMQLQLGDVEIGQGADTIFTQMASEASGIPMDKINIISFQDTDVSPFGNGAYGSRQTYVAGQAIHKTGLILKDKLLAHASLFLEYPKNELDLVDGDIIRISDGTVLMDLGTLEKNIKYDEVDGFHVTAESTTMVKAAPYTLGCTIAEVEVDIALCKVKLIDIVNCHDAGVLINPALAQAQVHGGMSMGIGYGLAEKLVFDPTTGRPLNNNLLDYKLSTFMDHPSLRAEFVVNPEPTSAYGAKGLGETPVCSVAPAIGNAIFNATGVSLKKIPMDYANLYENFIEAGLINDKKEGE
jgi:xanthine dehydrogenase molybdenum-binding subunit